MLFITTVFSLVCLVWSSNLTTDQSITEMRIRILGLEQRLHGIKLSNDQLQRQLSTSLKEHRRCRDFLDERYAIIFETSSLSEKVDLLDALGDTIDKIMPVYKDLSSKTACTPEPYIERSDSAVVLSSSSQWDKWHSVSRSTLNYAAEQRGAQAWIPRRNDKNSWIQADLGEIKEISAIALRGRGRLFGHRWVQYVTLYTLSYSADGINWEKNDTKLRGLEWIYPGKIFQDEIAIQRFTPPIRTRFIRLHPKGWRAIAAVRWELYGPGCKKGSEIALIESTNGDRLRSNDNLTKMNARFSILKSRLSWTGPAKPNTTDWVQVDLGYPREVTAIATQGSPLAPQFTSTYLLKYGNTTDQMNVYNNGTPLNGNGNQNTIVVHPLESFVARYVRVEPKTYTNKPALRWELYGPSARTIVEECLW